MSFSKSKLGVCFNRYELSICKKYFTGQFGQVIPMLVIKSGGDRARFHDTMLTNTAIQDPLAKTARSPKLDKLKRRDFFLDT